MGENIMKNLVRGGALTALLCLVVVFIYAQAKPENNLIIANDSQPKIENNNLVNNNLDPQDNTVVSKTALVKSSSSGGASKGAFVATAYCLQGKTALGHGVRRGLIAADPRVLRLGSRVRLEGGGYNGTYLVSDTGGAIKGKRIDIWVPNCGEARRFGRRTVQIFSAN